MVRLRADQFLAGDLDRRKGRVPVYPGSLSPFFLGPGEARHFELSISSTSWAVTTPVFRENGPRVLCEGNDELSLDMARAHFS